MQNPIFRTLVVVTLIAFNSSVHAAERLSLSSLSQDPALTITPIVGFETVYRDSPSPHTSTRTIYGARLNYGIPVFSGEAEYTRGSDTENYITAPEQIRNDDEQLKLGLTSAYHPIPISFVNVRAGGQASRGTKEITSGGVLTKTTKDLVVFPYAGAGLGFHLGSMITLSASSTVVFRDYKEMKKNDLQNVVALSIRIK